MTKRLDAPHYARTNLREVIDLQGRKVSWLAGTMKLSASHTSRVLSQQRPITGDVADKVSQLLGVPVDMLFDETYA